MQLPCTSGRYSLTTHVQFTLNLAATGARSLQDYSDHLLFKDGGHVVLMLGMLS